MHGHGFKPELQGLRAVAVLLVFLFHLEFGFVGGGYVGVDAFFVLSGYLITGSLVAEVERTGRIGLAAFYERRFRRLLPAATLVLAAILVFIAAFPRDQWPSIAREVAAASVYLENLLLAYYSVDYLAFDRVASPVQHYWSLSVEEQFYLFWPLFLIGAVSLGRRLGWPARRSCLAAILLALLLSLAWSVAAARAPRPGDYFYTHLRVWELALGGLVACAASSTARLATGRLAAPIQWTGLALLIGASVFYSAKTVFPGSAALVPVIGTALVIMVAAQGSPTRRNGLLDNPAMRWIGDISYSVYLWHWPIVIALKNRSGGVLGPWDALTAFLLTLILSQLTKVFVEDRFRVGGRARARTLPVRRIGVFVAIAVAIALPLLASATVLAAIAYDRHRFHTANLDPRDYPGAGILLPGSTAPLPTRPFFPPTHLVGLDIPKVYANECSLPYGGSTIRSCPSGTPDSPVTVAVVGDSHAAQWLPAFEVAGAKRGWRILPLTKSSCPLAAIRLTHPDAEACEAWTRNALAILTAHPPAVIVYTLYLDGEIAQLPSDEARMAAVRPMLSRLAGLGARVIVLRDTPHLAADPIAALEADATQPTILPSVPRPDDQDALARAAADLPGVSVLDLNAFICPNGQCFTAIGNVVVWRDRHHITARYAETLAPLLAERLAPSVTAGHAGNE